LKTEVYERVFNEYYRGGEIHSEKQPDTMKNQYVAGFGAGWSSADHRGASGSSTMGPYYKPLSRQEKVVSLSGTT
jgi:hypothetical protein